MENDGTKYPLVNYENATSGILKTLNTNLISDKHEDWEAARDDDDKVVYVYKPKNSMHYWGGTDDMISVSGWGSLMPPSEFGLRSGDRSYEELYAAISYVYPTNMPNFKDLVLITLKPLIEKRINSSRPNVPYTEDEFNTHYEDRGPDEDRGHDEWVGAILHPIHQEEEVDGSPGYVKIPDVVKDFHTAVGYLEEGSTVYYYFKTRNPTQQPPTPQPPTPQPPIGGGKRKSKRTKSKKRKSKRRKSKSKSKRRRRRSR